jgi:hypothetical protein
MLRNVLTNVQNFFASSTKLLNHMYGIEEEEEDQEKQEPKKAVAYEDKYLEKYKRLISRSNVPSKTSFVIESTSIGNVIMKYDSEKESFVYYSDHIVPFRLLEMVAMKYVCAFDCKQVYVERHEETVPNIATPKTTKDMLNQARNPSLNNKKDHVEVKMNRYSNSGRVSNFNILQPVAKHITDKKQLLKFSDFKAMSKC